MDTSLVCPLDESDIEVIDASGYHGGSILNCTPNLLFHFHKKEIMANTMNFQFSNELLDVIHRYETLFKERDIVTWKALAIIFGDAGVTLSTVDKKYLDSLLDCKLLLSIFYTILDNISEIHKDTDIVNKMIHLINNTQKENDCIENEKIHFLKEIWEKVNEKLKSLPRYEEFKNMFFYDFKQVLNSLEYTSLSTTCPEIINSTELEIYNSHGTMIFLINGMDLMASPDFDKQELGYVRTIFWHAQQIARTSKTVGTWKRNVKEKDLSSDMINYALTQGVVTLKDIYKQNQSELSSSVENSIVLSYFKNKITSDFKNIFNMKNKIRSINLDSYIQGLKNVINSHLACDGYI